MESTRGLHFSQLVNEKVTVLVTIVKGCSTPTTDCLNPTSFLITLQPGSEIESSYYKLFVSVRSSIAQIILHMGLCEFTVWFKDSECLVD